MIIKSSVSVTVDDIKERALSLEEARLDAIAQQWARDIDTEVLMSVMGWNSIKVSEGRVYGARYHTAEPAIDGYGLTTGFVSGDWNDMLAWCVDTFGASASVWEATPVVNERWYANNSKFWFRHEADLTLFLLRWS
jgi:hypothetical protein